MEGLEITELRLGLPGVLAAESGAVGKKKRSFAEMNVASAAAAAEDENSSSNDQRSDIQQSTKSTTRVIGWPPVCSYRQKNNNNSSSTTTQAVANKKKNIGKMKFYVKVSMDGAPYLRKVDLAAYAAYSDLSKALKELFGCFQIGGRLSGEDESDYSEYVTIYEDREGDWMLVGDVPWEMFTDSCKRLRIMKGSEAKGFPSLQLKSSPARVEHRTSRQHA